MISIRRVSLGGGFRYLMESVARGDGAANPSTPLASYYAASGTPSGRFVGGGLGALDDGRGVEAGAEVTEEHLWNMLGMLCDPVTGEPLGAAPRAPRGAPVAGFDLTFSPPKSVSTLWALADEATRELIEDCHRRAVDYVLAYAEKTVVRSRSGANGVIEEDIHGVIATAFTHFDSRAGDPQLHDHVVVWNRARSVSDGRWRTVDSRSLYKAVVALSELHQGVLSDYLTEALGVGWDARGRRHSVRPRWEITGVEEALLKEFSTRSAQVEDRTDNLIERFVADRDRAPTDTEVLDLRRVATVATRPAKTHRSLISMIEDWRQRATDHVNGDPLGWVGALRDRNDLPLLAAADLADDILADTARAVVDTVAERHATYTRHNLTAEAHRIIQGVRFAAPDERVAVAERITDLAVERSLAVTPPPLSHTPARYLRPDGSSRLRPASHELFTTPTVLDAEARLLDTARHTGAPTVLPSTIAAATTFARADDGVMLSADQAGAVAAIAGSGQRVDVLVGPAGTGKSTTMAALRAVWEAEYGPGSVVGLAPSAAAARVLADELGIDTDNTAKWVTEHRRHAERTVERDRIAARLTRTNPRSATTAGLRDKLTAIDGEIVRWELRAGQLIIVDEASLAGTLALDEIVSAAGDAGSKIVLIGDWAQLSAVDAGGAFALLVADRPDLAPQLTDVHRFAHPWEKQASIDLRAGHPAALDAYETHHRLVGGARDEILDAAYQAWSADVAAGRSSLMIAADTATVRELNSQARAERVAAGTVAGHGVSIAGGQTAGVGDEVVTRRNDRQTITGRRWVQNGDRWVVTATTDDGTLTVRRAVGHGMVTLGAEYVADHVELAYATTAHRAQGRTVDTVHALVSPATTREVLYVAATRGRASNRLYVDTAYDPDPQTGHDHQDAPRTARDVLEGVLANPGAERSAHQAIRAAHHDAESWSTVSAEYQTLAQAAQAERWQALLERCTLAVDDLEQIRTSPAHGPLLGALRHAEANGLDIDTALPQLVAARPVNGADDIASVLHRRVERWTQAAASRRHQPANLIAGLVPRARGVTDPDMHRALNERDQALETRARTLAEEAVADRTGWAASLGKPPADPVTREQWLQAISTVAAYRERWQITAHQPVGSLQTTTCTEQLEQRRRAHAAAHKAALVGRVQTESHHRQPADELQVTPPIDRGIDL